MTKTSSNDSSNNSVNKVSKFKGFSNIFFFIGNFLVKIKEKIKKENVVTSKHDITLGKTNFV
jgi:hypothetical protein